MLSRVQNRTLQYDCLVILILMAISRPCYCQADSDANKAEPGTPIILKQPANSVGDFDRGLHRHFPAGSIELDQAGKMKGHVLIHPYQQPTGIVPPMLKRHDFEYRDWKLIQERLQKQHQNKDVNQSKKSSQNQQPSNATRLLKNYDLENKDRKPIDDNRKLIDDSFKIEN